MFVPGGRQWVGGDLTGNAARRQSERENERRGGAEERGRASWPKREMETDGAG